MRYPSLAPVVLLLAASATAGCAPRSTPGTRPSVGAAIVSAGFCREAEGVIVHNAEAFPLRVVLWTVPAAVAGPGMAAGPYTRVPLADLAVLAAGASDTLPALRVGQRLEASAADGASQLARYPTVRFGCATAAPVETGS